MPHEIEVTCTLDGAAVSFSTWTDMSALLALRLGAGHAHPRRGCEAGQCGSCESTLNGEVVRLCQLPAASLCDVVVVTGRN